MIIRDFDLSDEERQQVREMKVEVRAKHVFRHLRKILDLNPDSAASTSIQRLIEDLFPAEFRPPSDYTKLLEAITLLERRGLVMRDLPKQLGSTGPNHLIVYLTSVGIKSDIEDDVILLVDKPEEIVRALEQRVRNLDPIVRQYYLESLRAYQEGLYISSVICLGAASERAVHWLAESIEFHFKQYQGKFKARRNMPDLIKYLSDSVIPNIFGADKNFVDELKKRLNGLGNLYRENRNEAGHPQTVDQSWLGEDQEYLLIQFRRYITTICKAIEKMSKRIDSLV